MCSTTKGLKTWKSLNSNVLHLHDVTLKWVGIQGFPAVFLSVIKSCQLQWIAPANQINPIPPVF